MADEIFEPGNIPADDETFVGDNIKPESEKKFYKRIKSKSYKNKSKKRNNEFRPQNSKPNRKSEQISLSITFYVLHILYYFSN